MIRSIIRVSALMTAGRGREIRDLVAKGGCGDVGLGRVRGILGSSARGVRVALSRVLY